MFRVSYLGCLKRSIVCKCRRAVLILLGFWFDIWGLEVYDCEFLDIASFLCIEFFPLLGVVSN